MISSKQQTGFTLVELSIVLVVIGLIVSSVLVGQDLIRQGEIRATVTQYEQFEAAIATFSSKYSGLPGDSQANRNYGIGNTAFGTGTEEGDADGVLEDGSLTNDFDEHTSELVLFWDHLGSNGAALISGGFTGAETNTTTIDTPETKVGNHWGVFGSNGINYYIIGATLSAANAEYTTVDTLSPLDAQSIDTKLDDGKPNSGIVVARDGANSNPNTAADNSGTDACVDTASPVAYDTSITSETCTLRLRMGF